MYKCVKLNRFILELACEMCQRGSMPNSLVVGKGREAIKWDVNAVENIEISKQESKMCCGNRWSE